MHESAFSLVHPKPLPHNLFLLILAHSIHHGYSCSKLLINDRDNYESPYSSTNPSILSIYPHRNWTDMDAASRTVDLECCLCVLWARFSISLKPYPRIWWFYQQNQKRSTYYMVILQDISPNHDAQQSLDIIYMVYAILAWLIFLMKWPEQSPISSTPQDSSTTSYSQQLPASFFSPRLQYSSKI